MNTLFINFLNQTQQSGGGLQLIIMMVVLFVIIYFFMIRPQQQKQKKAQQYRDSLTVGQEVVTIGGIHGIIKKIDDNEGLVTLNLATGVEVKFDKVAISSPIEMRK